MVWGVAYQRCQDISYVFGYIVRDRVYTADNGPERGPFFMDLGESILARNYVLGVKFNDRIPFQGTVIITQIQQ